MGCMLMFDDGSMLDITYDPLTESATFEATVMQNTYLGLGFGKSMDDVDMVIWVANNGTAE